MAMGLRDDLYFCLTDRSAIFLDLAANRYFGLTGFADLAFRRIVKGDTLDPSLERALQPLLSRGLIVPTDRATAVLPATIEPATKALVPDDEPATMLDCGVALGLRARLALEMRLRGLKRIVRRRRDRKAAAGDPGPAGRTVAAIVAAHHRVDRRFGGANLCLLRSLALIDHLARHGHFPDLVIGVRTGAFAAHCWVQQDGIVLNDEVDRVRPFTAIMIL